MTRLVEIRWNDNRLRSIAAFRSDPSVAIGPRKINLMFRLVLLRVIYLPEGLVERRVPAFGRN